MCGVQSFYQPRSNPDGYGKRSKLFFLSLVVKQQNPCHCLAGLHEVLAINPLSKTINQCNSLAVCNCVRRSDASLSGTGVSEKGYWKKFRWTELGNIVWEGTSQDRITLTLTLMTLIDIISDAVHLPDDLNAFLRRLTYWTVRCKPSFSSRISCYDGFKMLWGILILLYITIVFTIDTWDKMY